MIEAKDSSHSTNKNNTKHLLGDTIIINQNKIITLRGTVIDSVINEGLIGANVTIGNKGTVTDIDGNFELKIENNFPIEIIFTYVGYNEIVKTIYNPNEKIDILLRAQPLEITSGIVITGGAIREYSINEPSNIFSCQKKDIHKQKRHKH